LPEKRSGLCEGVSNDGPPALPAQAFAARTGRIIVYTVQANIASEPTLPEAGERDDASVLLASGTGATWKDLQVEIRELLPTETGRIIPENAEPQIVWILAGSARFEEREIGGSWLRTDIEKGDFFLTAPGPPYELRWKTTRLPYRAMLVSLALPVFGRAMKDVFGEDAGALTLRDISGFQDGLMSSLMEQLLTELELNHRASPLVVQGAAQILAVHLARNYTVVSGPMRDRKRGLGLPGFKIRKITELMAGNLAADFCLARFAREAEMSEFHFSRMFKRTTGRSPSQYFIGLKMEKARNLLRTTRRSVIEIGLEVGYTNPSHFAQVFRRETGSSPGSYRRAG
jgi:AraC family transcriptional regulator